ncbi:MAG: hypothetical protein QM758_00580 [Armatimonas sp.]
MNQEKAAYAAFFLFFGGDQMGFDYAIVVYYKNEHIAAALEDLTKWASLMPGENSQISLPDGVQIQVPFRSDLAKEWDALCLDTTLFLPEDPFYKKYLFSKEYDHFRIRRETNLIDVGYIYVYLHFGQAYSSLHFTAATTNMSLYFSESPEVHKTFYEYALRTQAEIALFDVEKEHSYLLLTDTKREISVWPEPAFGCSPDVVMAHISHEELKTFRDWWGGTIQ